MGIQWGRHYMRVSGSRTNNETSPRVPAAATDMLKCRSDTLLWTCKGMCQTMDGKSVVTRQEEEEEGVIKIATSW